MALRFIHTSDLHLGAPFRFLGDNSSEHKKKIRNSFANAIDHALKVKADLFLICGDLFDTPRPSNFNVDFITAELLRLSKAGVHTILLPGNHDHRQEGSIYTADKFTMIDPSYIHVIGKAGLELPELKVKVQGFTHFGKMEKEIGTLISRDEQFKYNLALIHGSINMGKENVSRTIELEELKRLNMDYVALGDWHGLLKLTKQIYYCGSPEVLEANQKNCGFILDVSLDDEGHIEVQEVKIGKLTVLELEVDVARFADRDALLKYIKAQAAKDVWLDLRLTGSCDLNMVIDTREMQSYLEDDFYALQIKDSTSVVLSEEDISEQSKDLVIGNYVNYLNKIKLKAGMDSNTIDKAIQLGITLLKGNDGD